MANPARSLARRRQVLQKSRYPDPGAPDFGCYRIAEGSGNLVVAGTRNWDFEMSLDDVEGWIEAWDKS
jgi:hypothetical protein